MDYSSPLVGHLTLCMKDLPLMLRSGNHFRKSSCKECKMIPAGEKQPFILTVNPAQADSHSPLQFNFSGVFQTTVFCAANSKDHVLIIPVVFLELFPQVKDERELFPVSDSFPVSLWGFSYGYWTSVPNWSLATTFASPALVVQ